MSHKIVKIEDYPNGYRINGKGILADNIQFYKKHCTYFSNQELKALENYIKAENYGKDK